MLKILLNFSILTLFPVVNAFPVSMTDSVVKVFITSNSTDYYRPWQSLGSNSSAGSGCVIRDNQILTNAHVVSDHTFVQVKKDSDPKKYTAKVIAMGNDSDLALLRVEDPSFFEGIIPFEFGELPNLRDKVTVIGYPQGGGKVSITEGVVSRMEETSYSQTGRKLLTVQIDAAINPGNSGGAIIQNGKLIGIAMQTFQSAQKIGYMIPMPIIDHFFEDLKDDTYDGFPILGIDFNTTENRTLREYYKINNKKGGVLISRILPFSPADKSLKEGDVIFEVDGIPISEDGTFKFRDDERLNLTYLVTRKQIGELVSLNVFRNGTNQKIEVKLTSFVPLVPFPEYFKTPPYYIYGGFIFTVLSTDLLKSWGNRWWEQAPLDFNHYLVGAGRLNSKRRHEIVVLLNVLPDDSNIGYHTHTNEIIIKVNGKEFNSFKEFVDLTSQIKHKERFTVLETERNIRIILSNNKIDEITQEILSRNNIPKPYSEDVASWLNSKEKFK